MTEVLVPCLPDLRRHTVVAQSNLLDSPTEQAFDRLTRLAGRLLGAPVALISVADDERLFFKSCIGLPEPLATCRELPMADSVCQFVVSSARPLILPDAREHPALQAHPAVRDLGVIAYVGVPLTLSSGVTIGSFCIIDGQPRAWTDDELAVLQELATSAVTEIELRLDIAARQRVEAALRAQQQEVRELNETLERRVVERTAQIERARRELEHEIAVREEAEAARRASEEALRLSEAHVRQAQKMEAMGRLAGGVAHDFNNLLTVIIGMAGLAMASADLTPRLREQLQDIEQAADRAAALTQQLLAFSRKQVLAPEVLELNELVTSTASMLRRLIGEDIELLTSTSMRPAYVRVDRNRLEQVLLNLAVNAQDAMPHGGQLAIDLDETNRATDALETGDLPPGPYIRLTVHDTGLGMDEDTCAQVFEPFFTTKPLGRGTGLGLSTVYGIVRQSGGYADVRSTAGRGTTFVLCFPRSADSPLARQGGQHRGGMPRGSETILLAEDEPQVRALTQRILEGCGYTVHAAGRGEDALALVERLAEPPALLITDMVMPGLNGRELAECMTARFPTLRVLLVSGYTDDALLRLGTIDLDYRFLNKPFTPISLATKVREILDLPH